MRSEVCPIRVHRGEPSFIELIEQRDIPHQETWKKFETAESIAQSITDMVVRGAPAIGITAAYGIAVGIERTERGLADWTLAQLCERFSKTRPTAVNLFWAIDRVRELDDPNSANLFALADQIFEEDRSNNLKMGEFGADLFSSESQVLTHCNTGGLATGGFGTALGVLRVLHHRGLLKNVWVDETRPYLQGARLTAWECLKDGLHATLITDSMAGHFMQRGEVDAVIVGTDRVAANGDVANKIGTYSLAVLCKHHGIPFYVAAPLSTLDPGTARGAEIEIEERSAEEVTSVRGQKIAPDVAVRHPAFDVTPAELVTAIVTEKGVIRAPYENSIAEVLK